MNSFWDFEGLGIVLWYYLRSWRCIIIVDFECFIFFGCVLLLRCLGKSEREFVIVIEEVVRVVVGGIGERGKRLFGGFLNFGF